MSEPAVDVFVSYKREDRARVAPLVDRLREKGLRVWWDADILGGASWRPEILRHLDAARCVIVVWSALAASPAGEFVHEEAARAKQRGVLVPVSLDDVQPPIGFGQLQTIDVNGWSGDSGDRRFEDVLRACRAVIDDGPRSQPSPPGRRRRWIASAIAVTAGAAAFALNVANLQSAVCGVPGLSAACGELGLGNVPSRAQRAAWLTRPAESCEWLRALIAREPDGPYAAEAAARLQARRSVVEEAWRPETHRVPMFVPMSARGLSSKAEAEADALHRGDRDAQRLCAAYDAPLFRAKSAGVDRSSIEWRCETRATAVRCGFEAQAQCDVEARHTTQRETCQ